MLVDNEAIPLGYHTSSYKGNLRLASRNYYAKVSKKDNQWGAFPLINKLKPDAVKINPSQSYTPII